MKKILIIVSILIVAGAAIGYYMYNKPRTGVAGLEPAHNVHAKEIFDEFQSDENAANAKYLGKVVEVSGTVQAFEEDQNGNFSVAMETGSDMGVVSCQFDKREDKPTLAAGATVRIKGYCSGLLLDVVLVDCEIVKS